MAKNIGLGKGLGALIDTGDVVSAGSSSINDVEISQIFPNPNQPRTYFDEEALQELAASIRELGVVSPITLKQNADGTYLIIAGERRYRACKMLGLKTIPSYIKTAKDEQVMEMALIENIQREDLNAIEISLTYLRLIEEYNLTQERLSERVGKKRTTIANYLRLLKLPAEIQMGIKDKKIDMGHARALLGLSDPAAQLFLYDAILKYEYSVRKVESLVRHFLANGGFDKAKQSTRDLSLKNLKEYDQLQDQLGKLFSAKVKLAFKDNGKGKISIPFNNEDDLTRIMELLDRI